ncbi:MAG: hypothetical protein JSW73_01950 [Candidatus Woesearchaeota archaeon]|nr:MAG: hypothetical protein JSW73_01950 [Candidatus Woesearchaeota archaeon]
MKRVSLSKITTKGKALILAYDHGLEHGPTDFTDKNVDPAYVLKIARKAKINAIALHKGLVEKYYNPKKDVPLILKLNGKTRLLKGDPISTTICTVEEAVELGAKALGYTIYVGSEHEQEMFKEFSKIEEEALDRKLPLVAWMYARGKAVKDPKSKEMLAYAARIGLELGADILKLQHTENPVKIKWAIKSAGEAKVMFAGGKTVDENSFLKGAKKIMDAGAAGLICGRNIWQHDKPVELAKALKKIVFNNASVAEAKKLLK